LSQATNPKGDGILLADLLNVERFPALLRQALNV
jgi:hypothetical protein